MARLAPALRAAATLLVALAVPGRAALDTWSTTGPEGGPVIALAVDPSTPTTMYAAAGFDVFKTTDGGARWRATSAGLINPTVELVIDPSRPSTVYAGTLSTGVYKSTNGGGTWVPMNQGLEAPAGILVDALAIDPLSPDTLYVALADRGLWKSTDGAGSWEPAGDELPDARVSAIGVEPGTDRVYVGTMGDGVWKTVDGGRNWRNTDLGAFVIETLLLDPADPESLYVGTNAFGIYRSPDGGANWIGGTGLTTSLVGRTVRSIALGTEPGTVYAGTTTDGVWRSETGGMSWANVNRQFDKRNVWALAAVPGTVSRVFAATGRGLFSSTSRGASWVPAQRGLVATSISALAVDPEGTIFAGGSGVFASGDTGTTWEPIHDGEGFGRDQPLELYVSSLAAEPRAPGTVYAGTLGGGVYVTGNGGVRWAPANAGLDDLLVHGLALDASATTTLLYAATGSGGVFKSPDAGATWEPRNEGLTDLTVRTVVVDPTDPLRLWAGTGGGGVFRSTDAAESWAPSLPSRDVYGILVDPSDPNRVYVGTTDGLFRTLNGGTSWAKSDTGITFQFVFTIALLPGSPATLYAGTLAGGVFASTDGAANWSSIYSGFPPVQFGVAALAVDPAAGAVYAATSGFGVFHRGRAICGDGKAEGSEACDDGSDNGTPGSACGLDCTIVPIPTTTSTSVPVARSTTTTTTSTLPRSGGPVCPVGGCDDRDACTTDACDTATGNCTHLPLAPTAPPGVTCMIENLRGTLAGPPAPLCTGRCNCTLGPALERITGTLGRAGEAKSPGKCRVRVRSAKRQVKELRGRIRRLVRHGCLGSASPTADLQAQALVERMRVLVRGGFCG